MNTTETEEADPMVLHDRCVKAIILAVVGGATNLRARGFTPEAIFEGTTKGAVVTMLDTTGINVRDVAILLRDFADGLDRLDKPNLRVVQ
jgi:hypothetical protein